LERARIKRRKRLAGIGGFLGGVSAPIALRFFSKQQEGVRQIMPAGALILIGGTVLMGVSIALWAMRPLRVTLAQRLAARLWRSRFGRWLFARTERRFARE